MVWRAKIMKHYQNATRTLLTRDAFASNCCRPISHRKFLRHVQSFNEIAIKVLNGFYIASRCSSARSTQIDISYSFFPESLFGVWWADVFRRMEMCNCTRCNQQKKVKISIFIPGFGNGLFLYFLHTVNESCAIFFLFILNPFFVRLFNSSSSMCAVEGIIWKCAIAHRENHVVLLHYFRSIRGLVGASLMSSSHYYFAIKLQQALDDAR